MDDVRVKWIHDCPLDSCGYDRGGTIWRPHQQFAKQYGLDGMNDWQLANDLGLTADPKPEPGKPFVMVSWDCRPGALQCHYWDELDVIQ